MYPSKISHCLWFLLLAFLSMCVVLFPLLALQSRQIITIDSNVLLLLVSILSVFVSYLLVRFFNRKADHPITLFENNCVITLKILTKVLSVSFACAILIQLGNMVVHSDVPATKVGWLYIFSAVVVGPIAEEMLFRGIFLRGLLQRYSPTAAIFMVSIAFALIHGAPSIGEYLWNVSYALIIGVVLGYLYYFKRSLLLNVLTHSAINLFSLVISALSAFII